MYAHSARVNTTTFFSLANKEFLIEGCLLKNRFAFCRETFEKKRE
jgi:hypothetical protein